MSEINELITYENASEIKVKMSESNEPTTYENASELKSTRQTKARSRPFIICAALAIVFFATTCVFLALFVSSHINNADRAPPQDAVCSTTDCVVTAARMISKMNISADPCVDFNEFACGRYISGLLPDGQSRWGTWEDLGHEHTMLKKGIITEDTKHGQPDMQFKMRTEYMKCMNEVSWEKGGLTSYTDLEIAKDWPTTNPNWTGDNFLLTAVIDKYSRMNLDNLFYSFQTHQDEKNSSKIAVHLGLPELSLPRDYFSQPRNDTVIKAYEQYLTAYAIAAGASPITASQDAIDVVNLEIALSQITPPNEETQDDRKNYHPYTVKELSTRYPELNLYQELQRFYDYLNELLARKPSKIENYTVIVKFPKYMDKISSVIKQFPNRTLQNLFGFKFAISQLKNLNGEMRIVQMAFDKMLYGTTGYDPRWQVCVKRVADVFSNDMQTLFNEKSPKDGSKSDMIKLIENMKEAFKQIVVENSWMSQTTKQEVYNKLAVIRLITSYLNDDVAENERIVEVTKKVAISEENKVAVQPPMENSDPTEEFNYLLWKYINTRPHHPADRVNAEFIPFENSIGVEPGIVHPPFFSRKSQNYLNYGALGMLLAHEMGHGFNTRGITYDDKGNLRNWWKESEMKTFLEKVQCLVNQTSGFYQDEIKMHVSSVYPLGETIADNIGLKTSYRAYKDLVRKNGEEPRLPNMDYTPDQLFFLSFSQLWCLKTTKERMVYHTRKESYIPDKYRTITALQNSEDFAKAYNCPRGSYMNPEKKCDVW